jgi:dienelactone hydrolase
VETFVDRTRRTVPGAGAPLASRTLVTTIYRPNGAGPFPLIVFSHGLDGHPEKFTKLFTAWVSAGFVISAPAFPLTNSHAENPNSNVGDVGQQPADVSFVLDKVLALNKEQGSRLFQVIDERRIGAGGLSLGGLSTYKLVYGECCRDERIDAVEVLDGIRTDDPIDGHVPLLIAHSDTDPTIPYSSALEAFTAARAPVWLITLHGALHASQWENDVTPFDHIAEQTTLDFWNATLKRQPQALTQLQRDATVVGLSSIVAKR